MKKMNFHSGNVAQKLALFGAASLLAALMQAQTATQMQSRTQSQVNRQQSSLATTAPRATPVRHHPARAKAGAAAAVPVPQPPPAPQVLTSLFDKPAQPAAITLANDTLTVHADNSSLTDILHRVASSSGMKIEGLSQDQRIFGTYGPGDPHAVIESLLDGSGYNVIMLGQTSDGTPRELTLSPRNNMPAPQAVRPMNAAVPVDHDDDLTEDDSQQAPVETPEPPPAPQRPTPNSVRTPQQMMQELQQMRQQQQQQQESQPQ